MNHQHPNIKFTFEVENNNYFSFLDAKICRKNSKFTTSVFRKPTFSDVFSNFDSFIPISYKHGLANTFIFRCFKFTSNKFLSVRDILMILLIFVLKFFLINFILPKENFQTDEKKQLLITIPFLGHLYFESGID